MGSSDTRCGKGALSNSGLRVTAAARIWPFVVILMSFAVTGACASREELIARSAAVPPGVNLSGEWVLRKADEAAVRRIDEAAANAIGGNDDIVPAIRSNDAFNQDRRARGSLVYVFLETGKSLKITQTNEGLFVSFDRSVVEEYRFGEKREINVGAISADRVSGWEDDAYVIETLDRNGAKLTERYRLQDNGATLVRSVAIFSGGRQQLAIAQVFEKANR
jgi:hypothetical protein